MSSVLCGTGAIDDVMSGFMIEGAVFPRRYFEGSIMKQSYLFYATTIRKELFFFGLVFGLSSDQKQEKEQILLHCVMCCI